MKPFTNFNGPVGVREVPGGHRPVTPLNDDVTPLEVRPTLTLTFPFGTSMRQINDAVIMKVLQYAHNNRLQAAELLKINPRTIRRHLGKKSVAGPVTRAA